jgi:signal transduction histidine kinase
VLHFVGGFVIGLLTGAVLFLYKRASKTQENGKDHLAQLEELSKLTGRLAHEIKNPLSTIKINLDLVSEELEALDSARSGQTGTRREEPGLARAGRKIAVIQKEADRLEHILDDFLRYIDRAELQLASTNINELVGDMIDFYSPQAYSRSVTIRQSLCPEALVCRVDADMLKQVMLNLFINAQQAMSNGGELMIKTQRQDREAVMEICDTGHGIAPERLPQIFEAYHSSRPRGSGLGLPIAKKIVDAHKGTISVNSELGKGTAFTIRLPLQAS